MILIFDSEAVCHQAKHSHPGFRNADKHTGVMFGFFNRLIKYYEEYQPEAIAFCWDSHRSLRRRLFAEYKQNRKDKKEERTQEEIDFDNEAAEAMQEIRRDVLPYMGFANILHQPGYEGDDHVAMICKRYQREDEKHVIISTDKDLYQLLDYADMNNGKFVMTADSFLEQFGIHPAQWVSVKAIGGCKSDNVIGIHGVAEKTAIKYMKEELAPGGKKYMSIISSKGKEIVERNLPLVQLPFSGCKVWTLKTDSLKTRNFREICRENRLNKFLKDGEIEKWRAMFSRLNKQHVEEPSVI